MKSKTPTQQFLASADYLLYELTFGNREQLRVITGAKDITTDDYKNYPDTYASFAFSIKPAFMSNRADRVVLLAHNNGTRSAVFRKRGTDFDRLEPAAPDDFPLAWREHTACAVSFGPMPISPAFQLGSVYITANAARSFSKAFVRYCFEQHIRKNWGDVDAHDRRNNNSALKSGARILSSYTDLRGERLWVITDGDDDEGVRHATTILLPGDY